MELTRQIPCPSLRPVSRRHSEGGSTAHSLPPCTCRNTHGKHCLCESRLGRSRFAPCRSRCAQRPWQGTGKEACRFMLIAAGNNGDLLGCTRAQSARKLSLQADTQVCLPQNYSLATPRLVAACEPAGLLACIALVPLKHAIRALKRLFAGLQGLVDILQVNQVCSGECTLRSHRGQRLRGALTSCKSSPGHAGRSRRRKHAHCQPGRVQAMLLSTWEAVCRAVTMMLTMRSPRGLQYPGSNVSLPLNVLMPVWKERMQRPSHCKMRPAFVKKHCWH